MNNCTTFESTLLIEQEQILAGLSFETRLLVLERTASILSGIDYQLYCQRRGYKTLCADLYPVSDMLAKSLSACSIPAHLALSSLSREPIPSSDQKKQGVFYTDFRLADLLAKDAVPWLNLDCSIADFACGSGILLAALAFEFKNLFPSEFNSWIRCHVFAFDLSPNALRAAAIPFLALASDATAVITMCENWKCQDSLSSNSKQLFDVVIGNPPWGKIKLSRHQFNLSNGSQEAYGADTVDASMLGAYSLERTKTIDYSREIKKNLSFKHTGDLDMYMAFLDLALKHTKASGHISFLVPSGLIHSLGTKSLREKLIAESEALSFSLMDNKAHFFSIDSRFKIVHLSLTKKQNEIQHGCISFTYRKVDYQKSVLRAGAYIHFDVEKLRGIRKDLSIPEFANEQSKNLFFQICDSGSIWNDQEGIWKSTVVREIDMTNDSGGFLEQQAPDSLPLIEGRMVQQFRFGAKTYVCGKGRKAIWKPSREVGLPHYYYSGTKTKTLRNRLFSARAGYCDIAGQTNERSVVSALIPGGVACGNKVPTILFDSGEDVALLWVGITNSFVFDWLARRVISTTLNYFLLFSIPMPKFEMSDQKVQNVIKMTRELCYATDKFYDGRRMELLRAEIDATVAMMYGLTLKNLELIMTDFPLLDRRQKPILGEKKSTITRDCFFAKFCEMTDNNGTEYITRYCLATEEGAKAYVPTEMTGLIKE